jgi:hypothetical protein
MPAMVSPDGSDPNVFAARADEHVEDTDLGRVQCPNCCKLAYVTRRSMGLIFYRCELCETVGATPDGA